MAKSVNSPSYPHFTARWLTLLLACQAFLVANFARLLRPGAAGNAATTGLFNAVTTYLSYTTYTQNVVAAETANFADYSFYKLFGGTEDDFAKNK